MATNKQRWRIKRRGANAKQKREREKEKEEERSSPRARRGETAGVSRIPLSSCSYIRPNFLSGAIQLLFDASARALSELGTPALFSLRRRSDGNDRRNLGRRPGSNNKINHSREDARLRCCGNIGNAGFKRQRGH